MGEGPTVVVVEGGDADGAGGESGGTAPAPPAYVTPGELDARLALFQNELGAQIAGAMETAWAARDAAERAADDAAVATAVAVDAAAQVDDAAAEEEAPAEAVDEAPQPPEKRSAPVKTKSAPKRAGYGAPWLYGKR